MKISKAAKIAGSLKRGMSRAATPEVTIYPTNGEHCCLLAVSKDKVIPRWEPSYDDLVADDWYANGNFR